MRVCAVVMTCLLITGTAAAQSGVRDAPVRWGSALILAGDAEGRVLQVTRRRPDRVVQLENAFGGGVGERWVWHEMDGRNPRSVYVEISGGRVVALWEQLHR
jgi:hypothetical protein